MNYIRQLFYDMRHQKMMTWVSIGGTAVSIFLVLVFFMYNSLPTVEVAPETHRQRIYGAMKLYVELTGEGKEGWNASGGLSYDAAQKLYGDLDGVEAISYVSSGSGSINVIVDGKPPVSSIAIGVDGNFWKIYNFNFITGRPFTEEECLNTTRPPIVLSEKMARHLFGIIDVVDREVNIGGRPYVVVGVVEGVNPILRNTWADVYMPLGEEWRKGWDGEPAYVFLGSLKVLLLYAEGTDPENIKAQVRSRYATLNSELEKLGGKTQYDNSPYDAETMGKNSWSKSPTVTNIAAKRWLVYALLLLLPAINLSSMMRGRLQHRISEIGVRRAYGARRRDIVGQLLGENFVVTIVGGCIGLILSYVFMLFFSSAFFSMVDRWSSLAAKMATPTFSMLFSWQAFAIALGACFVLNVLTASVPAWRASSLQPALAISKNKS